MSEDSLWQRRLFDPTSSAADSPAKTSRWLDDVLDYLESEAGSGSSSGASSASFLPVGFSSKTCLVCFPAAGVRSAARWPNESSGTSSESGNETRWREIVDAANAKSGRDYIALIQDAISRSSSPDWQNWGMGSHTAFWTLSGSEFPSGAVACSLSDVLETGDVPQKLFLSAKACRGILRRAEKRDRELPPSLKSALERMAMATGTETE